MMALSTAERWGLTLLSGVLITAFTRWPMLLIHEAFTVRDLYTEVQLEKRDAGERLASTLCADVGSNLYERHHCAIDQLLVDEWVGWRVIRKYGFRRHICNEINCESLYWAVYVLVLLSILWLLVRTIKGVSAGQQTTTLPSHYYSVEDLARAAAVVGQQLKPKTLPPLDFDPDVMALYNQKPKAASGSTVDEQQHMGARRRCAALF